MTAEGKEKCTTVRERLYRALERLLCKRFSVEGAREVLSRIRETVEQINRVTAEARDEWAAKFLEYKHIQWPKFIMDLIPSGVQNREEKSGATDKEEEECARRENA